MSIKCLQELMAIFRGASIPVKLHVLLRALVLPLDQVEAEVPRKGTIIDIGCGYGALCYYLGAKSSLRRIVGIDINPRKIAVCQKLKPGRNVRFIACDVKNLHLREYDVFLLVDILHHLTYEQQDRLLAEIRRKSSKATKLIIKEMDDKPRWKYWWNWIHDKLMTRGSGLCFIGKDKLQAKLQKLGFSCSEKAISHSSPYAHYLLVCQCKKI